MWIFGDGLTRDSSGKRTDKTKERDLVFSQWHRKYLSNKCYATDVDFYEYRIVNGEFVPKAFLEVKKAHVRSRRYILSANVRAAYELSIRVGIKFFIVLYETNDRDEITNFYVWDVESRESLQGYHEAGFEQYFRRISPPEFAELMEAL